MTKKFEGVLLCSDLDGTLAIGHDIPQKNIDALNYFMSEGGHFCVSTGRTARYLLHFPELVYNAPFICGNGTEIFDYKSMKTIYRATLAQTYMEPVHYALANFNSIQNVLFFPTKEDSEVLEAEQKESSNNGYSFLPTCNRSIQEKDLPQKPLLKIVLHFGQDSASCLACKQVLETRFSDFQFNRSWHTGLEMIPKNSDKGVCVNLLKEMLGDTCAVCVGDFENDRPMLEVADIAFTPENGWDELKRMADATLCDCKDGAIADLIERLPSFLENKIESL